MNDTNELHEGDKVWWRTHGTSTHGIVKDTMTADSRAAGRTVRADEDHPQYLVRSDKSDRDAVHTPQALHREPSKRESAQRESAQRESAQQESAQQDSP